MNVEMLTGILVAAAFLGFWGYIVYDLTHFQIDDKDKKE